MVNILTSFLLGATVIIATAWWLKRQVVLEEMADKQSSRKGTV